MTIGSRFELLMSNTACNIPRRRRTELLAEVTKWIESQSCLAKSHEEKFFMLGSIALIEMANRSKELQAAIGGQILQDAALQPELANSEKVTTK